MNPFDNLVSRLEKFKEFKPFKPGILRAGRAICPCCLGTNISKLSVSEKNEGALLVHCFGGCAAIDIIESIGLQTSDLYPPELKANHNMGSVRHMARVGIKGWEWWSLVAALEAAVELNTKLFVELSYHLPANNSARLIVAKIIGQQKDFADQLKFGRQK